MDELFEFEDVKGEVVSFSRDDVADMLRVDKSALSSRHLYQRNRPPTRRNRFWARDERSLAVVRESEAA